MLCETAESERERAEELAGKVAGVAGLEPVTSAVTGQRSNQLSYTPARGPLFYRVGGGVQGYSQKISQFHRAAPCLMDLRCTTHAL